MAPEIKICGMRHPGNIREVARLAPDFMGFIFHEKSPRSAFGLDPGVVRALPEGVTPVAVTVDKPESFLLSLARDYGFRTFQLHGSEPPSLCASLRRRRFTVWKAIPGNGDLALQAAHYAPEADMLLFDTPSASRGGSGHRFDWTLLRTLPSGIRFMLSGGIGPGDAREILALESPKPCAIDLNSRFETSPGIKDLALLTQFLPFFR